jgi:hypothetical protein
VILERLEDEAVAVRPAQVEARRGVAAQGIGARSPVPRDDGMAVRLPRVVDEEASADREVRREGEPEEPALAAAQDQRGEIEEVDRLQLVVLDDPDPSALFDDQLDVGYCTTATGWESPETTSSDDSCAYTGSCASQQKSRNSLATRMGTTFE